MSTNIKCGIFTSHFDFATGLNQISLQLIHTLKDKYHDIDFVIYTYGNTGNAINDFNKDVPYPIVNLFNKSFDEIVEILYRDHCDLIVSVIDTWFLAPLFIAKRSFKFYWIAIVFAESPATLPYHYDSSGKRIMHANYLTEADKIFGVGDNPIRSNLLWSDKYDLDIKMTCFSILTTPFIEDNTIYKYSQNRRDNFRSSVKLRDDMYLVIWIGRNFIRKDPIHFIKMAQLYNSDNVPFLMITSPQSTNTIDLRGFLSIYNVENVQYVTNIKQVDFSIAKFYILESNSSLDFSELANLYSGADCLINTSKAEGLGLPIIEAIKFGLTVIVPEYLDISKTFSQYFELFTMPYSGIDYIDPVSHGLWASLSNVYEPLIRISDDSHISFSSLIENWRNTPLNDQKVIRILNAKDGDSDIRALSRNGTFFKALCPSIEHIFDEE
jgi:glycosyltransferase involved in cell wall biosynthesis